MQKLSKISTQLLVASAIILTGSLSQANPLKKWLQDARESIQDSTLDAVKKADDPKANDKATSAMGPDGMIKYTKENIREHMGESLTSRARRGDYNNLNCPQDLMNGIKMRLMSPKLKNVMLTGPAGTGKTTMAECFARTLVEMSSQSAAEFKTKLREDYSSLVKDIAEAETAAGNKMTEDEIFAHLTDNADGMLASWKDQEVVLVDFTDVTGGTSYRGQLEDKLKSYIEWAADPANNAITFFDEAHLMAKGNKSGEADPGNILKPAMTRGDLRMIFATTNDEFAATWARDAALNRRVHHINIKEPTDGEALVILQANRKAYEEAFGVLISDDALRAIIAIAKDFSDLAFPGSALKILDTVTARKSFMGLDNKYLNEMRTKIRELHALGRESDKEAVMHMFRKISSMSNFMKSQEDISVRIANNQTTLVAKQTEYRGLTDEIDPDGVRDAELSKEILELKEEVAEDIAARRQLVREYMEENQNVLTSSQETDYYNIGYLMPEDVYAGAAEEAGKDASVVARSAEDSMAELDATLKAAMKSQEEALDGFRSSELRRANQLTTKKPTMYFTVGEAEPASTLGDILKRNITGKEKHIEIDFSQPNTDVEHLFGDIKKRGTSQKGIITEAVQNNAYETIVLRNVDDISDPQVLEIIGRLMNDTRLPVMIEGTPTRVNFQHTTFILHSRGMDLSDDVIIDVAQRSGTDQTVALSQGLRAVPEGDEAANMFNSNQKLKNALAKLVMKSDATIFWRQVKEDDMLEIIRGPIKDLADDLARRNIPMTLTPKAEKAILAKVRQFTTDSIDGMSDVLRLVLNDEVIEPVNRLFGNGSAHNGRAILVNADDAGELSFQVYRPKPGN